MVRDENENIKCLICYQSFGCKDHLITHVRTVHENDALFTCAICQQSFGEIGTLRDHVGTVHEKEKFTCLILSL